MEKVILIGGAPTTGKSHLARKLAEDLSLPWISTDGIREMMRKIVRKAEYPALFHVVSPGVSAKKYLNIHTAQEVMEDQNRESREVWKGVRAMIETDYVWRSFIVEGVAVVPGLVREIRKDIAVTPIFLLQNNEQRVRKVVFKRGLWDDANTYPDDVKEKEVQWVMRFNSWIKKEAAKHKMPVVEVGDGDGYIDKVKKLLV